MHTENKYETKTSVILWSEETPTKDTQPFPCIFSFATDILAPHTTAALDLVINHSLRREK